ncbi:MAG: 30S ribosomal protein S7 [Dehalococcoidia bacterium]|nr:MAG: 30S ribosomal protein S7 [Dehalococcoidia bacterium]
MSRRAKFVNKEVGPDPKFGSQVVARFINKIMYKGKKSTAQGIVYDAFDRISKQMKTEPLNIFEQAMKNVTPSLQVKSRRVGGATYQVPIEVSPERGEFLATKWIITYARDRGGRSMAEKLAAELMEAAQGQGNSIKKKQDTHKMAEANKAFAHYRW